MFLFYKCYLKKIKNYLQQYVTVILDASYSTLDGYGFTAINLVEPESFLNSTLTFVVPPLQYEDPNVVSIPFNVYCNLPT